MGEAPLPQRARGYWKARFSAFGEGLEKLLEAEHAQLPPWVVIGFGTGIAAWFALGRPSEWQAFICVAAALALIGFAFGSGRAGRALGWFAATAMLGCALVWGRSVLVAQPRLGHAVVAQFDGRVVTVDHLQARGTTRAVVVTSSPGLPPKLRLSIDDDKVPAGLAPGAEIEVRARLVPPPPMALPGTYDFARDAWFQGLGAVGKPLGDLTVVKAGQAKGLDRARSALREHIQEHLPSAPAGIAVALATGDQNAVDQDDADAMRCAALASHTCCPSAAFILRPSSPSRCSSASSCSRSVSGLRFGSTSCSSQPASPRLRESATRYSRGRRCRPSEVASPRS
jgi:competence protein ComEC